ncbi:MAG: hypothetical protein RLZZ444_1008 [Pseudomonadota bacterium]
MAGSELLQNLSDGPCVVECPVRRALDILDGKWTLLVVRDLLSGKKRYSELQRSLEGISPRLLSQRLRDLEAQGLVLRRVFPTNPPTTEYELTEQGLAMRGIIGALAEFGATMA